MKYIFALCFLALATNAFASENTEDIELKRGRALLQVLFEEDKSYSIVKVSAVNADEKTIAVHVKADLKNEEGTYEDCNAVFGRDEQNADYLKLTIDCPGQQTVTKNYPGRSIAPLVSKAVRSV